MRPEGEAKTGQPTPQEETDQTVRSTRRVKWAVTFYSVSLPRRTALSSAQLSPTRFGAERAHVWESWLWQAASQGAPALFPAHPLANKLLSCSSLNDTPTVGWQGRGDLPSKIQGGKKGHRTS